MDVCPCASSKINGGKSRTFEVSKAKLNFFKTSNILSLGDINSKNYSCVRSNIAFSHFHLRIRPTIKQDLSIYIGKTRLLNQ